MLALKPTYVLPKTFTRQHAPLVVLRSQPVKRHIPRLIAFPSADPLSGCLPVWPDMSIVPRKYHAFMMPSLRRVYLGDGEDNKARIESLSTEISTLKARVGALHRDNGLLMGRCESAHSTISRLALAERDARLALNKATKDLRLANQTLESLRKEYRILISQ
jgi:outer membrane murein-binding lipoprotein Lpp